MKRRKKPPTIPIGTSGSGFFKRRIEILVSDAKTHLHLIGVSGCLHPDTPIFDPLDKTTRSVYQRYLAAQPFHVIALNERNEPVIAEAQPPQQFTKEKMYRVELSTGESFTVTWKHRVFVGNGYETVDELAERVSHLQKSSGAFPLKRRDDGDAHVLLPSISGTDLLASISDAQRWMKTRADFQAGCRHVSRLYDRPLQSEASSDLASSPSRDDAQQLDCVSCGAGAPGRRCRCNPSGGDDHASKLDSALHERSNSSSVQRDHFSEDISRSCRAFAPS